MTKQSYLHQILQGRRLMLLDEKSISIQIAHGSEDADSRAPYCDSPIFILPDVVYLIQ